MILHARGRTCRTSVDTVSAKSLHRLIERLGKPLAERPHRDYSIEESEEAQQILRAENGGRQRFL